MSIEERWEYDITTTREDQRAQPETIHKNNPERYKPTTPDTPQDKPCFKPSKLGGSYEGSYLD